MVTGLTTGRRVGVETRIGNYRTRKMALTCQEGGASEVRPFSASSPIYQLLAWLGLGPFPLTLHPYPWVRVASFLPFNHKSEMTLL